MPSYIYPIGWQFCTALGKKMFAGSSFSTVLSTEASYPIHGTPRIILVQVRI